MKLIPSFFLLVFLFSLSNCKKPSPDPQPVSVSHVATLQIPANDPAFQYTGRIDFSNPKSPAFDFPGISIKAKFQGGAVNIIMKDSVFGIDDYGDPFHNFFNVFIDGGTPKIIALNNIDTIYPISNNLSDGDHIIEVFKRTEGRDSKCEFRGLQIVQGKTLLPLAATSRKMEFIGGSFTCGYGMECSTPDSFFQCKNGKQLFVFWCNRGTKLISAIFSSGKFRHRSI